MALTHFPLQNAAISYGASTVWGQLQEDVGAGVMGLNDFKVTANATSGVTVTIGANGKGVAYVPYTSVNTGGLRRVENSANSVSGAVGSPGSDWTAVFTNMDVTNPRLDSVYLIVRDSTLDATGAQDAKLVVATGTATAGATLDNRTNAAAVPNNGNAILLADVLIPAGSGAHTIVAGDIRDRRPFASNNNPSTFTVVDQVTFQPLPGSVVASGQILGITNAQAAAAMWLPRRIVSATKVRWNYIQPVTTADTGNWNIGICDASGRPIVSTGSTAFTGAADSNQSISATITATTFEAGVYWIYFGHTDVGGVSPHTWGVSHRGGTGRVVTAAPNTFAYLSSGGITLAATIAGLTDAYTTPSSNVQYGVPIISLTVG